MNLNLNAVARKAKQLAPEIIMCGVSFAIGAIAMNHQSNKDKELSRDSFVMTLDDIKHMDETGECLLVQTDTKDYYIGTLQEK